MKAVLHDSVNACPRVEIGASPSALWNTSPSTVSVAGHVAADDGLSPLRNNADEVSTLNVDPGGYAPSSAVL